jgi:peptide/nickel transport system substrate-binding protein
MKKHRSYGLIAAVGLLALVGPLAGCSADGGASGSPDRTLTIAIPTEPTSLEPCDTQAADGVGVIRGNVVESLTDIDPKTSKVIPLLATSWEQTAPTTWVFKLRQGVKYQDGTTFDASAAVYGIERTMDKTLNCLNQQEFPTPITAKAVDASTLEITTAQPDPILPLRISYADLASPKTPMDAKTSKPVGTGPYEYDSREVGTNFKIKRWAGYWGTKPEATEVTYIFRQEDSVRADTVKAGEADIAVPISSQYATTDDRTKPYAQNRVFFLRAKTDKAPLNDIRVRQAIAYAVDKDTIAKQLMDKIGKPFDQLVNHSVNGYIPDYVGPKYDVAKAKSLLAAAKADGVDTSIKINLDSRPDLMPNADEIVQAVAQNLTDAGFNIKYQNLGNAAWQELNANPTKSDAVNIMAVSHDNVSGDAVFSFPKLIATGGINSTVSDPKVDDLLAQANVASGDERAALYQKAALTEYTDDAAIIPVAEQFSLLLLGKNVEYTPNGLTGVQLHIADVHFDK